MKRGLLYEVRRGLKDKLAVYVVDVYGDTWRAVKAGRGRVQVLGDEEWIDIKDIVKVAVF